MNFFDQIFSSMRGVQGVTAIHNTVQGKVRCNPMRCQCQFEQTLNQIIQSHVANDSILLVDAAYKCNRIT